MRKYEQRILDAGIYYKSVDFKSGCYPEWIEKYYKEKSMYQHPIQMSRLLEFLETKEINTYIEIGTWWGSTFTFMDKWLRAKNPKLLSYTIDVRSHRIQLAKDHTDNTELANYRDRYKWLYKEEMEEVIGKGLDLCFIDGSHIYKDIVKDYEEYGQYAKYCVFHDIRAKNVPDARKYWEELKVGKQWIEIVDQYRGCKEHFGYGILVNE